MPDGKLALTRKLGASHFTGSSHRWKPYCWLGVDGRKNVQQSRKPLSATLLLHWGCHLLSGDSQCEFLCCARAIIISPFGEDEVPQNEGWSRTALDPGQQQHWWPVAPLVGQEMIAHTKEELWFWWSPTICSCTLYLAQLFSGTTHLYCAPTDRSYLSPSTTWLPFRKYFIASVLWSIKLHGSATLFGRLSKTAFFPNWLLSHFALGCALWNIPTCSLCNPGTSRWTLLY